MSGVPLDPPKDYGDIPPPGICCFPRECEGIGEADNPPHNALKKLVGATGIKPVTLTMSIFGRTFLCRRGHAAATSAAVAADEAAFAW
jgi:hypothetical protein